MVSKVLLFSESLFDKLQKIWENQKFNKIVSNSLVLIFIGSIIISYLDRNKVISLGKLDDFFSNPFFAIEISFTLLLIIELLSLIFVLPESVAKSVSKQFELLSLIFIRSGFKEISHIKDFEWHTMSDSLGNLFTYAIGSLIIFVILGFNSRLQKHARLTYSEDDQIEFIQTKKLLALILLIAFIGVGIYDTSFLIETGTYLHSFHLFYSVLIFSDIIIVLIALRYTLDYLKIYRYSAFVLATLLIRISLTAPPFYNVIIGVSSAFFILMLTVSYNYFLKELSEN